VPGAIWPARAGEFRPAHPTRPDGNPPERPELLHELWLISNFGWIADATICRALIISGAQEILANGLGDRLQQLLHRGWVEQRRSDGGADAPEWRLTDSGRDVLADRD